LLENGLRGEQEFADDFLEGYNVSRECRGWPATWEQKVEDKLAVENMGTRKNERMEYSG